KAVRHLSADGYVRRLAGVHGLEPRGQHVDEHVEQQRDAAGLSGTPTPTLRRIAVGRLRHVTEHDTVLHQPFHQLTQALGVLWYVHLYQEAHAHIETAPVRQHRALVVGRLTLGDGASDVAEVVFLRRRQAANAALSQEIALAALEQRPPLPRFEQLRI